MRKFKMLSFLMLLVICLFVPSMVYAAEIDSSAVIEDLKEDPAFNREDYPDKKDDYSLHVIQIAETLKKELIIYVYQPSHETIDLLGTKVSISYGFSKDGKGLEPKLYPLELLSTSGVFDKYLVKNFEVPKDTKRYYNIVSIFREFNTSIDTQSEGDFDFTDMAYSVGQQWYAYDINNSIAYEMNTFNTMVIDTIFNENFEFNHGLTWGNFVGAFNYGDCWFIAFNCEDYVIKHIYDADMSYTEQKISESWVMFFGSTYEYGDKEPKTITLTDNDVMSYTGDGLGARTFKWNRILSSSEFIKNVESNKVNIRDDVKQKVESSQWVFTYTETERTYISSEGSYTQSYYDISEVGILRLHFLDVSSKTYDLGVVNSLTDPDNVPGGIGTTKILEEIEDFFSKLFAILGLVVLVLILMFFSNLLNPLITILSYIVKAVIYVLTLPFKIIKWVFRK